MVEDAAASRSRGDGSSRWAIPAAAIALLGIVAIAAAQAELEPGRSGLRAILLVASIGAGVAVVPASGRSITASFIVIILAAALLGPTSAVACALVAEVAAALKRRSRAKWVVFNLLGSMGPALVAGNLVRVLSSGPTQTGRFYLVVAFAALVDLILNFAVFAVSPSLLEGKPRISPRMSLDYAPTMGLNIVLALAGVAIYLKVGLAGIVFALIALFTFSYMAHLLEQSRQRAEQYVSLSWGVLAGLMRSLDVRDEHAARHAAAVARFARDMAKAVGMGEHEQELAHTAGLLHDIGRFALSDRVAERGRTLTDEDWVAIQQHPELGADMLKDLGMYGPVAEIVLSHHERIDGRGYPRGLTADQIPEIAKIIAVAEVYDTLTASDTYRTRMSSFEALRELRRVADTQLDGRYVEVLAELLSGEGVEYRHADAADFDSELDMERRIKEAGTG